MRRKHGCIWGLVLGVALVGSAALGQSAIETLREALNLSSYPSDTQPPAFASHTATGQPVSLDALHGRVVLLTFWATWCAECRPEMPLFERLHRDFAAQGLTVLGVNFREDKQAIEAYAKALDLTFSLVLDSHGTITRSYGVIGLPTTILIGRDGRPAALAVGPRDWGSEPARSLMQALLAEPVVDKEQ
jgi:peroxiredoxin